MKYIKTYEDKKLLDDLLKENPMHKTHDFYIFLGSDNFVEDKNGLYKKTIDIENMVRITGDNQSLNAISGLQMRSMAQQGVRIYHIWLPNDIRNDVEGKGSNSIEPWLIDLINSHKQQGSDEHGKKVFKDVKQRKSDMEKYNL